MENVADALKIAFGILVFVIALAISVMLINQARTTSEMIFHVSDKTEFYQYATDKTITDGGDRIVGMETIIPTIQRYAKEQFAVTIFASNLQPIVRYDLWTEGMMNDWTSISTQDINTGKYSKEFYQIKERLDLLNKTVCNTKNAVYTPLTDENVISIVKKLYGVKGGNGVGAPWLGSDHEILKRIEADMNDTEYKRNSITYTGKNLKKELSKYTFIEKFIEITTSGKTITEDGYSLETIKGNKTLEIIYIMQE